MTDLKNRRLSAIMFTDLVGYSALMNRDESAAIELLKNNKRITTAIVDNFNGTIIKGTGDGFYIEFTSAVNAVRCGIDIQKEISKYNTKAKNKDERIILRIGIHLGDIFINDDDIFGDGVNIASRIESLADPGGICITETVYDQIKNKVEIQTFELGKTELKSFKDKINIYKVLLEAQEKLDDIDSDNNKSSTDNSKDIKSTIKEKIKSSIEDKIPNIDINTEDEEVKIDSTGIHVKDKDGSKVDIDLEGIHVKDKDGSKVNIDLSGIDVENVKKKIKNINRKKEISNIWKAIITLISGIGFLVFIMGIFLDLYPFRYGVIGAIAIAVLVNSLKTLLQYNLIKAISKLLAGIGFLVFIVGIFLDFYHFWYGVIGAIAIAILANSLKALFGIKDYSIDEKGKKHWD